MMCIFICKYIEVTECSIEYQLIIFSRFGQFYFAFVITIYIEKMKDKAIWWLITLLLLCSGLKIQIGDRLTLQQSYTFVCSGAKGDVKYYFQNLPFGVKVDNNRIFIEKQRPPRQGDYLVQIKAEDSTKQSNQAKVVISVKKMRQSSSISSKNNPNSVLNIKKNDQPSKNEKKSADSPNYVNFPNQIQITTKAGKTSIPNIRRTQLAEKQAPATTAADTPDYDAINKIISSLNFSSGSQILPNPPRSKDNSIDKLPTDTAPSKTNIDALLISTKKAPTVPTSLRKSPPAESDLKLTNAFNRQIAAGKAVANLLSIVKQSTANRNAALDQAKTREQIYELDRNNQQQKNQTLFNSQLEYSQNYQTLRSTTENIKNWKTRSEQISSTLTFKNKQKQLIIKNIQQNQDKTINTQTLIKLTQQQNVELNSTKAKKEDECEILDQQFGVAMDEKEVKIDQIIDVRMRLVPARRQVELTLDHINDLKAQLAKAEKSMKQSLFVVHYYESQQKELNQNLQQIQQRVNISKTKMDTCHEKLNNITAQIYKNQNQKIVDLKRDKAEALATIRMQADNLSRINLELEELPKQLEGLKAQISISQNNAVILQKILADLQPRIFIMQGQSFDANERAQKSKKNLQAIMKKIQDEQKKIDEETINLQKARTQKELADQQVDKLLRSSATVPLFATTTDTTYPTINSLVSKQLQIIASNNTQSKDNNSTDNATIDNSTIDISKNLSITAPDNSTDNTVDNVNSTDGSNNNFFPGNASNLSNITAGSIEENKKNSDSQQKLKVALAKPGQTAELKEPAPVKKQLDYFIYSGAIRYFTPVGDGTYQIKNMPEFVLHFFGPKIQPPIIDSLTILYPIKPQFNLTQISLPPLGEISVAGYAISTRSNSFGLLTDSGQFLQIVYSSVIKIFSIEPSAQIAAGSKVILRGIPKENSKLLATFVFFLSL